jgi:cell division septum initiation protein DivIVA
MNTVNFAILAALLGYIAIIMTIIAFKTRQALITTGRPLGKQMEALRAEFAEIADAKLMADARLASAALIAVARLAREAGEDPDLLMEAKRTAQKMIDKADKTAELLQPDGKDPA